MAVWTPEEVDRFLAACTQDRLRALFILALTTGLRQGELLALSWENVDLVRGVVAVRHSLSDVNGQLTMNAPKSGKTRVVDMDPTSIMALKRHREVMLAEGFRGGLVFRDTRGNAVRRSNMVNRWFRALIKQAGVPDIRFHDLRHTAATLMLNQGIHPKVVQERLGHASISITMDIYSHVLPSLQQEAAAKMGAFWTAHGHGEQPGPADGKPDIGCK